MQIINFLKEKDCYLCYLKHDINIISCYGPFDNFMVVDKYAKFIPSIYNQSAVLLSCSKLVPKYLQYKYLEYKILHNYTIKLEEPQSD